jgi:putative membrane protein
MNLYAWNFDPTMIIALLVGTVGYLWVTGPFARSRGVRPASLLERNRFFLAMVFLFLAVVSPIDTLSLVSLSMHMVQHMILSYMVTPLALLATPEWLFRILIGNGKTYRVVRALTLPVVGVVVYNLTLLLTHTPALVNKSAEGGPLHYSLHVLVVTTSLMFWTPVCGPIREWRMSDGAKMIYLFGTSLIPTIPAGWLTFAEGAVYDHYDHGVRVWGVSMLSDQQAAGGIMKLGGSIFMWIIIIGIFFSRFIGNFYAEQSYDKSREMPDEEIVGTEPPLTFEEVEAAFGRSKPAPESPSTSA